MPIPSPCTSVCQIDDISQLCKGCWRTLDEIAAWSTSTDAKKQAIWQSIEQRKNHHHHHHQHQHQHQHQQQNGESGDKP